MFRFILYPLAILILYLIFREYQVAVAYVDLKDYLGTLLNLSGMIFTIMGIWIAFIYPNALLRLSNPKKVEHVDFSASRDETKRLEGLVGTVIKSVFVMTGIMFIFFAKAIFSGLPVYAEYKPEFIAACLSITFTLSVMQFESIVYVVFSNVMFINDIHSKRENLEGDEDI